MRGMQKHGRAARRVLPHDVSMSWRCIYWQIVDYRNRCRCRAQFCYLCGLTWKKCACPQFAERHLLNRAEQIVDRDGGNVNDMMEHLRVNHECVEHNWRWTSGYATPKQGLSSV